MRRTMKASLTGSPEAIDLDHDIIFQMQSNIVPPTERGLICVMQAHVEAAKEVPKEDISLHVREIHAHTHPRTLAERDEIFLGCICTIP